MKRKRTKSGAKAHQRSDTERRVQPYSEWHRTLDKRLLMLDVDFIEWRFRGGDLVPVGVMEVTRVDLGKSVSERYLKSILSRYNERDLQGKVARRVAQDLGTNAYVVLFREDCSEFWIYNLTCSAGWWHCNPEEMEAFLHRLRSPPAKTIG